MNKKANIKIMIESLQNLKLAFNEVNKSWYLCNTMDELTKANYPFQESFDELNIKVSNWTDDSIEELNEIYNEKNY